MTTSELLRSPRYLSEQQNFIDNYITKLEAQQLNAPKGFIRLQSSKGYPRYYLYKNKADIKGQYLSADNINLISAICQRDYNAKLLKRLQELKCLIQRNIPIDLYDEIDKIFFSFAAGKQSLITPIIPVLDSYVEKWKAVHPGSQNDYEITNGIYTNNNELVRSKSEKIIADRLAFFDIPYVYEPGLILNEHLKYPDFIILNKRTRQTFIWEHFGLIDNDEYSSNNLIKIELYERCGYFPGEKLICSFESKDAPVDSQLIDRKITDYLL